MTTQDVSSQAGRELKTRAAMVTGCVISATQRAVPELMALTKEVQALRRQLAA